METILILMIIAVLFLCAILAIGVVYSNHDNPTDEEIYQNIIESKSKQNN